MPLVIHVVGTSSSGKSSSIRTFMENRHVRFSHQPKDFRVVLQIMKTASVWLGVGSAGDDVRSVDANFDLFEERYDMAYQQDIPHLCDIMVCASKRKGSLSYGQVMDRYSQLTAHHPMNYVSVQTRKMQNPAPAALAAEWARVAGIIENHIP